MINLKRLGQSFKYAIRGLTHTLLVHQNLRIHLLAGLAAVVLGAVFKISNTEWVAILIAISLVLVAEMINTALEEIINLVKEDHNARAQIAKDVSAGMVLLTAIFAVIMGSMVFLPHLISLL